jgi:hypothetical protein
MDAAILGYWRVRSIDMVENRAVTLIGGRSGEIVEFAADGRYVLWGDPHRPTKSSHFRTFVRKQRRALDVWIKDLEPLTTHCIYDIDGLNLAICIAGDSRARPTEPKRDDNRPWCMMHLARCEPPPKVRRRKPRKLLEPGRLIPKGFLDDIRPKRRK